MEPRFKKDMDKRRLKKAKPDCPGGNCLCKDCGANANIISLEMLLSGSQENPYKGSSCDFCGECEP